MLVLALVTLAVVGWASPAFAQDEPRPEKVQELVITGPRVVEMKRVERWVGWPPSKHEFRAEWAQKAATRVVRKYKRRGYAYARAWAAVDPETGAVAIHVDEGVMHRIVFRGANVVSALIYRVDIDLPGDVFHEETVETIVSELSRKHGFRNLYFKVKDSPSLEVTPLGRAVQERELNFYVLSEKQSGFGFGMGIHGSWGLIPWARGRVYDLLFEDDQASGRVEIGVPYRQYAFEQSPQWQWVYGKVDLAYRTPPLISVIATRLDGDFSLERHARTDVNLDTYVVSRNLGLFSIIALLDSTEVSLGGGISHTELFFVEGNDAAVIDDRATRWTHRLRATIDFTPELLRRDQLDVVDLTATFGFGATEDTGWLLELWAESQFVFHPGWLDLIVRQRAFWIDGDVHFWEERNLSGSYLRVFFGRYVQRAAQVDAQLRFPFKENSVMGGIWYDYSVFIEHDQDGVVHMGQAHAVGPSLNFVFFDFVALDVYYGFGWDPDFTHNLYLTATTIY